MSQLPARPQVVVLVAAALVALASGINGRCLSLKSYET